MSPDVVVCARLVDDFLAQQLSAEDRHGVRVLEAMRYSLFAGGKRIRATMTMIAAETFGEDRMAVLPAAAAIEMIHTATLIHDDLPCIDDSDLRRGKPSCHKAYGEATALLAGDALIIGAFEILATQARTHDPAAVAEAIGEVAHFTGGQGLIAGEAADIAAEKRPLDEDMLTYVHENKTAALFQAAARTGAILARAPAQGLQALTDYAYHFGRVFQITDDILDVVGDADKMGKRPGTDERLSKATFPRLCGVEGSRALARQFAERARLAVERLPAKREFWLWLLDFLLAREA